MQFQTSVRVAFLAAVFAVVFVVTSQTLSTREVFEGAVKINGLFAIKIMSTKYQKMERARTFVISSSRSSTGSMRVDSFPHFEQWTVLFTDPEVRK